MKWDFNGGLNSGVVLISWWS